MAKQLTFDDLPPEVVPEGYERLLSPDEIFKSADADLLTRLKESRYVERKTAGFSGEDLGEYICKWANTQPDGGIIVSGQQDTGSFDGCMRLSQQQVNGLEECYCNYCPDARIQTKHIRVTNQDGKPDFVFLTRVYYNPRIVAKTTKGKAFKRVADTCVELGEDETRELEAEKGLFSAEKQDPSLLYPVDFRVADIARFIAAVRRERRYAESLTRPSHRRQRRCPACGAKWSYHYRRLEYDLLTAFGFATTAHHAARVVGCSYPTAHRRSPASGPPCGTGPGTRSDRR